MANTYNIVTEEKLEKYFKITTEALEKALKAPKAPASHSQAADALDMVSRYVSDAKHFREKGDFVLAFAALNYAHGWLDAAARFKLFEVHDSRLFTVDDKD